MKKSLKLIAGITVVAGLLFTTGAVFADTAGDAVYGQGFGRGTGEGEEGQLSEYMEAAMADVLGLTVEEIEAREAAGETHYTIALELGFTAEEFAALLNSAREEAMAAAAQDGIVINQFGLNGNAPGRMGSGPMNPDGCLEGTCTMQQAGAGLRRGANR